MPAKRRTHSVCVAIALSIAAVARGQEQSPRIERLDPALDAIIASDAKFEPLKTDYFGYLEGPVWVPATPAGYLLFSDVPANRIYKWDGRLSVWMEPSGFTGKDSLNAGMEFNNGRIQIIALGSNGLTLDREGRLVFCTHGDRALKRRDKDGTVAVLADRFEGKRFNGPNDVVVRSDGAIYFTDLFGGLRGNRSIGARELPYGLYLLKDAKLQVLDREPSFGTAADAPEIGPNGLAFSPDETHLYVGAGQNIFRYDVQIDGRLTNRTLLIDLGGGGVDGVKVDLAGNIFAMGPGGIWIVSPAGKPLGRLRIAGANLAFGDADGKTLYIAAGRDLYRIRLNAPGIHPIPAGANR
jgi:gluconolactonase